MSYHVRFDSPHGRRASDRRLAIEHCEERIALSATSGTTAETITLSHPSTQGLYLSGASFNLFDRSGQVVATAQFDRDSDAMIIDYASGDSLRLNGEFLKLSTAGVPMWMGSDPWRIISPPEEIAGAPGTILPLPLKVPDPALPHTGAAASEPQMFHNTISEGTSLANTTVESADLNSQLPFAVQPRHDRPRNSAVFFEVASTTALHAAQKTSAPTQDLVEPRSNPSPQPQANSASHSEKLIPREASTVSAMDPTIVTGQEADSAIARSKPTAQLAIFHGGHADRGHSNSKDQLAEWPGADLAGRSRHAAFADWEVQENASPLVTTSRSHFPEVLAVAIAAMAARDRQLATRKSAATATMPTNSARLRGPGDKTEQ